MSFKKNKFCIIKKAIEANLAEFIYNYFLIKQEVAKTLFKTKWISPFETILGTFDDKQVPNSYAHYADIAMETLLIKLQPLMEKHTGLKLQPAYSYARLYKKNNILKRHKDRFSCEVSTTMFLGGDPWDIYLESSGKKGMKGIKIDLKPGDMMVYRGCEVEHWRNKFKGKECAQGFLHYNAITTSGAKTNIFDGRPHVGIPGGFKIFSDPATYGYKRSIK